MQNHFDVIVIGVGAMGASTCFHLARRGIKVLGLEQFDIPHSMGSSHGDSRVIRKAYYEHPNYVPLLHRAYALWDELEAVSGRRILHRTGGVFAGPPNSHVVQGALWAAQLHKLPHELIDRDELRRRWPQIVVPEDWNAFVESDTGALLPERAITAYAEFAMRHGAVLHGREPVRSWRAEGSGYVVQTDAATYAADRLIFCGGAWSDKLLGDLGIKLKVTRQTLAWVWPNQPSLFELGRMPVWGIDSLDGGMYYGFPMLDVSPGFKFAHHQPGDTAVDPDTVSREPTAADRQALLPILPHHFPAAIGPILKMKICLYTNSPDGHFIIDRHPQHPGVYVACGFSGHGFKFSSVIGQVLADAGMSERLTPDVSFLSFNRFSV